MLHNALSVATAAVDAGEQSRVRLLLWRVARLDCWMPTRSCLLGHFFIFEVAVGHGFPCAVHLGAALLSP